MLSSGFFRLLLMTAGGCAGAASLLGFLGGLGWFLDLASHFRVQYLLGMVLVGSVLAILGRPREALAILILGTPNLAAIAPFYLTPRSIEGETDGRPLRAVLANVSFPRGDARIVQEMIEDLDPDLLVLEEVDEKWLSRLQGMERRFLHSVLVPRKDNFGIALHSKHRILSEEVLYLGEAHVPSIQVIVGIEGRPLHVLAAHPPAPGRGRYARMRDEQLRLLGEILAEVDGEKILIGDLNATPWSCPFRSLVDRAGLVDSARGWGIQPTWPTFRPLMGIPIDHFLHSEGIRVLRRRTGPNVGSDHFPLIVEFTRHTPS